MSSAENDAINTELRVRRALGLTADAPRHGQQQQQHPDPARHRRRFVQDGEVPVVVLGGDRGSDAAMQARNRVADLETALNGERAARAAATRSLEEARETIQSLQTRLVHAEIAYNEAMNGAQQARVEAEKALQGAVAGARTAEEPGTAETPANRTIPQKRAAAPRAAPRANAATQKPEPQPVKWWLPSGRAKKHPR